MPNPFNFMGVQIAADGSAIEDGTAPPYPWPTPIPPGPTEDSVTYPDGVPSVPAASYITPPGEGTATDSLPIPPHYSLELVFEFPTERIFESTMGYESLQVGGPRGRRGYQLRWVAVPVADKDTLLAFFEAHRTEPFFFTAPGDSQRSWQLTDPEVKKKELAPDAWALTVTVTEVFA